MGKKENAPKDSGVQLSGEQSEEIRELITNQDPDQLEMPFVLWTRRAVQNLIKWKFGIDMPLRAIGDYLKSWGFVVRKPSKASSASKKSKNSECRDEETIKK